MLSFVPPTPPSTPSNIAQQSPSPRLSAWQPLALSGIHSQFVPGELLLALGESSQFINEEMFAASPPVESGKHADEIGVTQAAGVSHDYTSHAPDGEDQRKPIVARLLYLKHRNRQLQQQLQETKENAERETTSAHNLIDQLQDEIAALKERLSCFEKMVAAPEELEEVTAKALVYYEQQLRDSDDNLALAKESFQSASAILQSEIATLEQDKQALVRAAIEAADAHSRILARSDAKAAKLQTFMDRFEVELTSAKIQNSILEEELRRSEEECDKLRSASGAGTATAATMTTEASSSPRVTVDSSSTVPASADAFAHSPHLPRASSLFAQLNQLAALGQRHSPELPANRTSM